MGDLLVCHSTEDVRPVEWKILAVHLPQFRAYGAGERAAGVAKQRWDRELGVGGVVSHSRVDYKRLA